jgi:FMN phosphatase YigB (HAD superfamily)/LmbE family N-acetylglucosaminyl deacetylase
VEDAAGKLRSAYREGKAAFDAVLQDAHIFSEALKAECLRAYRGHSPVLQLDGGVRRTLEELRRRGKHLGIVTDGRPESQRAKIEALGLLELVDEIIVTDELGGEPFRKPCDIAFRIMQRRFGCDYGEMVYIGDNPRKDFAAPLALGMRCCRVQIPDGLYGGEPTPDGVVCTAASASCFRRVKPMKILVIAPHPDDEILGVGGTILKNSAAETGERRHPDQGTAPIFTEESVKRLWDEAAACHEFLGVSEVQSCGFPAAMLETVPGMSSTPFDKNNPGTRARTRSIIPHWGDMQKDHQLVAEAAMVALRPKYEHRVKRIFAYETLSETGWNVPALNNAFIPNVFVDIGRLYIKKWRPFGSTSLSCPGSPIPGRRSRRGLARFGLDGVLEASEAFVLVREVR